jgi:hypothetical protein
MCNILYKIEIFSYWHAGSGLAAGADVDLLCIKDKDRFPFIPGKTLKGLLKDAALDLFDAGVLDIKIINEIFGREARKDELDNILKSTVGEANFSNAELTQNVKEALKDKTNLLYRKISSTAIDYKGQAKEHSLRRMEVAVPIVLFAKISNTNRVVELEKCMKMLKRFGTSRNRGLGRCDFHIIKECEK